MISHVVPVAVFVSTTMTSGAALALLYVLVCRRAWRGLALDGAAVNRIRRVARAHLTAILPNVTNRVQALVVVASALWADFIMRDELQFCRTVE
jgi:hypothetical protein